MTGSRKKPDRLPRARSVARPVSRRFSNRAPEKLTAESPTRTKAVPSRSSLIQRHEKVSRTVNEGEDVHFVIQYSIKHSVSLMKDKQLSNGRIANFRDDSAAIGEFT